MNPVKIQLVVPRKNYIKDAYEIFNTFNYLDYIDEEEKQDMSVIFEEVVVPAESIPDFHYDADVIISRGLMSKLLRKYSNGIPIVDIPVQGIDLIHCLNESRKKFGKKKIAVIGARNMIYGVENLETIIDLPIQKYIMDDLNESKRLVKLAKKDNCEVVISGLTTCEHALALDLESVIVETGRESFIQALSEAFRLAIVSRKEQERAKQFETILDHAYEGVIAIDLKGRISVINESALSILDIPEQEMIGKPISDVLLKGELLYLLLSNSDFKEDIISYNAVQLSVKKVTFYLRNNKVGDMVTFQDVTGIQELESEIRRKNHLRGHVAKYTFDDIVFTSNVVKETIETAKKYSEVDSNILIIGETGTGKEMYAQSIHNHSNRKIHPFVAINCAALPENLLESELFGYVEGAFTGAMKGGKQGFFELAHQGTLFLDEIGEISPKLQSRLLRVLQEREVMRIGDDKIIPVNVRIIAATNKNLLDMAQQNKFREDLYYRLSVLNLDLPPLRTYSDDIPLLAKTFIKEFTHPTQSIELSNTASQWLKEQSWEGNIRQLQNFCERLAVLYKGARVTERELEYMVPKSARGINQNKSIVEPIKSESLISEKNIIIQALKEHHFNRGKVAAELGVSRTTLWRKMKKYNIETN